MRHAQPPGDRRHRRALAAVRSTFDHQQQQVALGSELTSAYHPRRVGIEPAQCGSQRGRVSYLIEEGLLGEPDGRDPLRSGAWRPAGTAIVPAPPSSTARYPVSVHRNRLVGYSRVVPRISEEDRTDRRQRLVDAAWRRLAAAGYHTTSVDDLCDEAGVSKGGFYGYFASKQDLFLALVEEETEALNRIAGGLAQQPLTGAERVRRFTQAMLRVGDDPGRVQLRADLWSALATDPAIRGTFADAVERRRSILRDWIVRSILAGDLAIEERRANALASILIALTDGLMLHRAVDPTGFRWSNIRSVLDSLLAGIDRSGGG